MVTRTDLEYSISALCLAPMYRATQIKRMQRRDFVLCALLSALPIASVRADGDPHAPFAGRFEFVGGDAERKALKDAIDRAVASMFFAIRSTARGKLVEKTEIAPWFSFQFQDGRITSAAPGAPGVVSPESGAESPYKLNGETLRVSQRVQGGHLVQRFVSDDGARENEYVPNADGKNMLVQVTLTSPHLSRPLRYTLSYARK